MLPGSIDRDERMRRRSSQFLVGPFVVLAAGSCLLLILLATPAVDAAALHQPCHRYSDCLQLQQQQPSLLPPSKRSAGAYDFVRFGRRSADMPAQQPFLELAGGVAPSKRDKYDYIRFGKRSSPVWDSWIN